MPLYPVEDAEHPQIVALVNLSYRGTGAGWTSEDYILGERLTVGMLREDLANTPQARLLAWRETADGPALGCVWLEPAGPDAVYLGMLTVRPDLQAAGLGRLILAAAEARALAAGARKVRMTVINIRRTLIAWYGRRGYALTGETLPFPYEDARFGAPQRPDLSFVVMERTLEPAMAEQA